MMAVGGYVTPNWWCFVCLSLVLSCLHCDLQDQQSFKPSTVESRFVPGPHTLHYYSKFQNPGALTCCISVTLSFNGSLFLSNSISTTPVAFFYTFSEADWLGVRHKSRACRGSASTVRLADELFPSSSHLELLGRHLCTRCWLFFL